MFGEERHQRGVRGVEDRLLGAVERFGVHERERPVDFLTLQSRLAPHGDVRSNDLILKFRPSGSEYEMTVFPDGRAIIKGTSDVDRARTLYAKYIGH